MLCYIKEKEIYQIYDALYYPHKQQYSYLEEYNTFENIINHEKKKD